jgi:hypothetical protein
MNNTLYLPVSVEPDFIDYINEARDKFVLFMNAQDWNTELRKQAEVLLIAYDQMGDKLSKQPLSLEEVRDYLAGVQGNDLASVASHTASVGNSIELSNELLISLGFTLITGGSFENIKMPYFCKDAVLLFFNESRTEHEYNSFLIGYGFNDFSGKYYAARFKWIKSLGELEAIYNSITNKKLNSEQKGKDVASDIIEPERKFYCKEYDSVGYTCEEQCRACNKAENAPDLEPEHDPNEINSCNYCGGLIHWSVKFCDEQCKAASMNLALAIEAAIRHTLVVENKQSIGITVNKILSLLNKEQTPERNVATELNSSTEPLPNKELPTLEPEQGEAVAFANWLNENNYQFGEDNKTFYDLLDEKFTTKQLYQLFKNKKP